MPALCLLPCIITEGSELQLGAGVWIDGGEEWKETRVPGFSLYITPHPPCLVCFLRVSPPESRTVYAWQAKILHVSKECSWGLIVKKEPSNIPDFPAFLHGEGGKPFHNCGNLEMGYIRTHTQQAHPVRCFNNHLYLWDSLTKAPYWACPRMHYSQEKSRVDKYGNLAYSAGCECFYINSH